MNQGIRMINKQKSQSKARNFQLKLATLPKNWSSKIYIFNKIPFSIQPKFQKVNLNKFLLGFGVDVKHILI